MGGGEDGGLIATLALKIPPYSNQRVHRASFYSSPLQESISHSCLNITHHSSNSSPQYVLLQKDRHIWCMFCANMVAHISIQIWSDCNHNNNLASPN